MPTFKKEYFSKDVKEIVKPDVYQINSRYDTKMRLRMQNDKLVIRNLKKKDLVAQQTSADIIHTVLPIEAHRPEAIALKYYGDARLYWIILAANNLRDRTELKDGMLINIPSKRAIYGSDGLLLR